jgi:uncharacterized protein YuzE
MATLTLEQNKTREYANLARKRVDFGDDWKEMEYSDEVDLLFIRFSDNKAARSKGDVENGIVYNYDRNDKLVSIEILDLYEVFV